jgi:hypothetical protein
MWPVAAITFWVLALILGMLWCREARQHQHTRRRMASWRRLALATVVGPGDLEDRIADLAAAPRPRHEPTPLRTLHHASRSIAWHH